MKKVILLLSVTLIFALSPSDIPNFDKYYKPREFQNMDMYQNGHGIDTNNQSIFLSSGKQDLEIIQIVPLYQKISVLTLMISL